MRVLHIIFLLLFLTSCGTTNYVRPSYTQQDLHKALWLKVGATKETVISLLGEPAKEETIEQVTGYHYCRTGASVDQFVLISFKDNKLSTVKRYSVSGEQVHGATGDCSKFVIPMNYSGWKFVTVIPANENKTKEKGKSGRLTTGTGFFVSNDGYLLTNSHVVDGAGKISIILNGKKTKAVLIDQDESNDIALLKVDEKLKGLPLEFKNKTQQGEGVLVLGYPNIGLQGNNQKATFGYINASSGIKGDTRYFQISAPIQPGNSGSPMLNEKGVVIGIASASLNQSAMIDATGTLAQNVNYAVKIAYALPMLIGNSVSYSEADNAVLSKTDIVEKIKNSVVLVVSE